MPTAIEQQPLKIESIQKPSLKENQILENLETLQNKINPYFEKLKIPPTPIETVDPKLAQEAMDTVNEIRKFYGEPPITNISVTRRLLSLLNRIAAVVENHLFFKKEKNHKEETKIKDETVPNIKSWTKGQGIIFEISAFLPAGLAIAGVLIPYLKEILPVLSQTSSTIAQGADKMIESWKSPEEYEKNLHIQTVTSKKQAEEGLKNLPLQIQQLLMKLNDQIQQMIRSTGQRM